MKTLKNILKIWFPAFLSLVLIGLVTWSCSSESEDQVPSPTADRCEGVEVSLASDIIPIIQQNCAVAGCHVSGTGRVDFTNKNNIISNANLIRTNTQSGFMPPSNSGKALSTQQKDAIYCWVANGAQDN